MEGEHEKIRAWARRIHEIAQEPVSDQVIGNVRNRLHTSAEKRSERGVGPDGRPFKPLSKRYAARKRKDGVAQTFWVGSGRKGRGGGQSKNSITERIVGRSIHQFIGTPYSGFVHDGASYTRRAATSSSLEARQNYLKAMAKRKRAFNTRLKEMYGKRTAAQNRREHAKALREAAVARRRGKAELLPQFRRTFRGRLSREEATAIRAGRASKVSKRLRQSWRVVIPARPILGVDADDERYIEEQLLRDVAERLGD